MDKPTNSKSIVLVMDEVENELVSTVNELMAKYDLPCYLLELIFDKIHRQLKDGAKKEIVAERRQAERTEDVTK